MEGLEAESTVMTPHWMLELDDDMVKPSNIAMESLGIFHFIYEHSRKKTIYFGYAQLHEVTKIQHSSISSNSGFTNQFNLMYFKTLTGRKILTLCSLR